MKTGRYKIYRLFYLHNGTRSVFTTCAISPKIALKQIIKGIREEWDEDEILEDMEPHLNETKFTWKTNELTDSFEMDLK